MLPAWFASSLWNRHQPERPMNPWKFPLMTSIVFLLLAVIGAKEHDYEGEALVVGLGMIPAILWCWMRWKKHQPTNSDHF